jgi:hypothetical protein
MVMMMRMIAHSLAAVLGVERHEDMGGMRLGAATAAAATAASEVEIPVVQAQLKHEHAFDGGKGPIHPSIHPSIHPQIYQYTHKHK